MYIDTHFSVYDWKDLERFIDFSIHAQGKTTGKKLVIPQQIIELFLTPDIFCLQFWNLFNKIFNFSHR